MDSDTDTNTNTTTTALDDHAADPVVTLSGVSKRLGGNEALRDVSLTLHEGEVYGLLGPNGAGKTTTLRTVLGLFRPDAGRVRVFGEPPREADLGNVGVVFEYETLKPSWSVRDNLSLTCHVHELPTDRIEPCLERVRLDPAVADEPFDTLSKGMQRKASLADALLPDPDVLVLDEPAAGLDPESREAVLELVKSSGRTILFSSHALDDVQRVCDRVGIVRDGRTVVETALDESLRVFREPQPGVETERLAPDVELYRPAEETPDDGDNDTPDPERIDAQELYFALTDDGGDRR